MIDLTTGIRLSSNEIEGAVTPTPPQFIELKDDSVEYAFGFPNMMLSLWGYICTFRRFPSQTEYCDYYRHVHSVSLKKLNHKAVLARVLRSYPSLVREIHFYALILESGKFESVSYSAFSDVEQGIDLHVGVGGRVYNISCFVQTKRAVEFRIKKKLHRHMGYPNSLEVPLDLKSGKHCNGWIFFDSNHVDALQNEIINYAWENYRQHPLELLCG